MGYTITDEKDKTLHWAYAIDEGYGRDPYIELIIGLGQKPIGYKLPVDTREAQAVAKMLRNLACEIEAAVKTIHARQRTTRRQDVVES